MPNPFDQFDAPTGAAPVAAAANPFDQFDTIAGNAAMAVSRNDGRPSAAGDFIMGGSEVPRLDSNGALASAPTNRDVLALQQAVANAPKGQVLGGADDARANFDARFGAGATQQYLDADARPHPVAPSAPSAPAYGEGAGYLIDNPLTRGLAQGGNAVATGASYLIGRGLNAVAPSAGQWWDRTQTQPLLAHDQQLAAPNDAGLISQSVQLGGNLAAQLASGIATGGAATPATTLVRGGLMAAAKTAATSPAARIAGSLGLTQAGHDAAQMEASGQTVPLSRLGTMAVTDTAANLVPVAGPWSLPARVASGAVVGEAANEATNVAAGRPLGTGAGVATAMGGAFGLLPGHYAPTLADEGRALAQRVMFGNRVDFLRDATARQDLDERMAAAAQQNGGVVHPDVAAQLADQVANEHGTSVDALVQAPRNPMEAGTAAADAMLADMQQTLATTAAKTAPNTVAVAPSMSLPDAASLIDRRLSALDELAGQAKPSAELRQLGNDAGSLEDLLRGEYAKRQEGVVRSPENSLTDDELAQAEQHFAAVRAELEKHRQAVAAGNEAKRLRDRLAKVDSDAELVQLVQQHIAPIADAGRAEAAPVPRVEPPTPVKPEAPTSPAAESNPFDRFDTAPRVGAPAPPSDGLAGEAPDVSIDRGALADLAPRAPAVPDVHPGVSRDDLVQRWNAAQTDAEKAAAAASIRAFDQQEAPPPATEATAPKFSRETAPAGNTDLLTEGFKTLAENPDFFRNQLLPGKTPSELAKQAGGTTYSGAGFLNGMPAHEFIVDQGKAGKARAYLFDDGNDVWIDVSNLKSGGGAGEKVYNLAFSYAKNNGKNFIEDPAGLSDSAMYRRPVQQTSAMLKAGSADNIGFERDGTGFLQTRRPGGPDTRPIKYDAGRRLDPTLREHLLTVYNNTVKTVPEIEHYAYDPARGSFVDRRTGEAVGDGVFDRLAGDRHADPVREAMVRVGDSESGQRLEPAPVGSNSLKVAAIAGTLLRAQPHEVHQLLGGLREVAARGVRDTPLEGILPSKYNEAPADAGVSVSEGDAAGSGDVRQSQSTEQTATPTKFTVDQVRDSARKAWGNRFIVRLERAGVLHMITADDAAARGLAKSADELAGVKGLYVDGKAYVLTDQVRNLADVPGIVVHEAGLHYGYDRLTTQPERMALRNRVNRALAAGDPDMVKAWRHAEDVDTPAKALHEEAMAYLTENAPGHDIVTRLVDAVKRGLNRAGVPLDLLETDSDAIRRTARDMLRRAANPKAHTGPVRVEAGGDQPWRASTVRGAPVFSRDAERPAPPSEGRGVSGDRNSDVRYSQAAKVRQQAAITRQSVLSQLAAQGYGQGALGWTGNPNEYGGWRGGVLAAMQKLADKMDPVKRVQNAIHDATGVTIADDANVYRLENLMHGRVADRLDTLDRTMVKPLLRSMKEQKLSPDLLMDYLYARHAPERNARIASINKGMPDGGSGMSTQLANDILAGKADGVYSGQRITADNLPALQKLAARVDRMREQTLTTLEDSGQVTPALAASLRKQWQHYVPLRGKEGDADTSGQGQGAGRGVDIKGKPVKRALGRGDGNLAPNTILAEMVGDAQRAIIQAEKARVGRAILKLAAEHPNPDVWQVEPVDLEWKFSESTGETYLATRKPNNDKDVLTVVHDGTAYHVRLKDPRLQEAVLNLGAEKGEWLVRTIGKLNRWLSAAFTRYSPAFIPINAMRDAVMGFSGLAAEHGHAVALSAARDYFPAMRAAFRDVRHAPGDASVPDAQKSMDDWAREFSENGGKTGIVKWERTEDTQQKLQRDFERGMGMMYNLRANPRAAASQALHTLAPIIHAIEHTNDAVENAMRLAAYVAVRKRGMSVDKAAAYAKDLTVNFNRKGGVGGVINSLFLFYNASVQGVRRSVQLMGNRKIQGFLGGLMAMQASQTAILMARQDEDGISDWDAIPDYVKQRALIIALPGHGHYFAMPMPYEFGFLTYAGGRLTQWGMQKAGKGADPSSHANVISDLGNGLLQSFSPIPLDNGFSGLIPTPLRIPAQVYANKNDFDHMIYNDHPMARYKMPASESVRAGTAAPYVWMANALNRAGGGDAYHRPQIMQGMLDWSPNQLQFLVDSFVGGMGNFGNRAWGTTSKALAGNYKVAKDGTVQTDWPKLLSELPVLQRLGWNIDHGRAQSARFNDIEDNLERTRAQINDKLTAGDFAGAQQAARDAGVFGDGWTIRTTKDGEPITTAKSVNGKTVRVPQLGVVPGSLAAAHKEVVQGLSMKPDGARYTQKVQLGLQELNDQYRHAMTLPSTERERAIKQVRDEQAGLMGAFLRFYNQRKDAYDTAQSRQ